MNSMKTILLTWWTGFLGSHIIEDLRKKYHIIALKRSTSDLSRISNFFSDIVCYDIDTQDIESIFQNHTIDIIVHTATNYGRNYRYLSDIIEANLFFPIKLLDFAMKYWIEAFLNTDTFWDENIELPTGLKYYALTKKDFLKYAHLATDSSSVKMKFLNLKIEHLYWFRDDNTKFLPYIFSSLVQDTPSIKLTKWEQKRDFIYIKDAVHAYDTIIQNLDNILLPFEDFDIGTWQVHTIREIVEELKILLWANTELLFGAIEYRKWETMEAKADIEKLSGLGWKSKYNLNEGLREVISLMKNG